MYIFRYSDAKTFGTVSVVSKELSWIMMASQYHPHKYELPLVLVPQCIYQCLNRAKLIQSQFLYGIRMRRATSRVRRWGLQRVERSPDIAARIAPEKMTFIDKKDTAVAPKYVDWD